MNEFDETPHTNQYYVSFDRRLIDDSFVLKQLATSYWASTQPPIVTLRAMEHSLCVGVYQRVPCDHEDFPHTKDVMVGFARAVTDNATFCWICDVLIDPKHRGKGLGKFLVQEMVKHPSIGGINCMLRSQDAHALYAKFDFKPVDAMRRLATKK
jgi:GNAT superfamily N-acetyltransferase